MSQPYVGEIRLFGGNFAPQGWAFCDGSTLAISEFEVLFNLIGTTYGGDGQSTFNLPDLRGRLPVHMGTSNLGSTYVIGQRAGEEQVTLTTGQLPIHTHVPQANTGTGTEASPAGNVWAGSANLPYKAGTPGAAVAPQAVQGAGGGLPHDNMVPFLAVNFIISLFGIFPSQN
jgi:microcystin-dependent protein